MKLNNTSHNILFFTILALVSLFYGYGDILFKGPYSIHQWRQTDCLSITANYYQNNLNFLEPAIKWCDMKGNSKTVSEFPIIYYGISKIWKVTGKSETLYRFVDVLIVFIGLFMLFRNFKNTIPNFFWAVFGSIFLFTSPVLIFYANNFTADAPALGLALCGLYFIMKFYKHQQQKQLIWACLLFTLAGLIKISSLLSFLAALPGILYLIFEDRTFNFKKVKLLLPIAFVFFIITSWYVYAHYYNNRNLNCIFLVGILPIWDLPAFKIKELAVSLFNDLLPSFFQKGALYGQFLILIYLILNYKKANKLLLIFLINAYFGAFLYIILFFQVFDVHDYYLTNLLIIIPLTLLVFGEYMYRNHNPVLDSSQSKILASIVLISLIYYAAVNNRIRYDSQDFLVKKSFIVDKRTQDFWNWYHWNYANTFKALETIEPYLRSLGIKQDEIVVSIPDISINVSLYLMNQRGFTDFGRSGLNKDIEMKLYMKLGAKYLIINDKSVYEREYIKAFINHKIGTYKNVDIYKLEP